MSAKSLFTKIRSAMLALGRSERAATRKARLLSGASFADFVRLAPEQNAKLGLSPKARHYALKGARVTKAMPTISSRQKRLASKAAYRARCSLDPAFRESECQRARERRRKYPDEARAQKKKSAREELSPSVRRD